MAAWMGERGLKAFLNFLTNAVKFSNPTLAPFVPIEYAFSIMAFFYSPAVPPSMNERMKMILSSSVG